MFNKLISSQKKFFHTGVTRSYDFRIKALDSLQKSILKFESSIYKALEKDLNKSAAETYLTEIGIALNEISFHKRHLKKWMKIKKVKSSLAQFPGKNYIYSEPYGLVLIIAPWNYPFHLCLLPLIGAISSGNTVVIKPSEHSAQSSSVIAEIISSTFKSEYISVVQGSVDESTALLEENFDYIFFTGSTQVGRIVMGAASKNLTPLTLELGGKSPVIIDSSANISLAAKKVAFGKIINAGQTCVAPDYLLIEESIEKQFITQFETAVNKFFFEDKSKDAMVRIVNKKHYNRLKNLLKDGDIVFGGKFNDDENFIEPTLIKNVTLKSAIMKEEIFGPLLPIITYSNIEEAIEYVRNFNKPLSLYIFSQSKENIDRILKNCSFGGGCINDVLMQLTNPNLPFGGIGSSGFGSYHGKKSFDTFTHYKSIFKQSGFFDMPLRYPPYSENKLKLIKKILK
ncbi:aldehyde dehydrogenase family protein [Anaerosphaera multitolerans]|uniref:aldehyde dehydrogenase family protein n=1 Tax=Anaerosphaera multitolerans TaxID=2487351 RepID=UPI00196A6626|nr:aldehyde dehydrogenase family protein [Anaerosphaera multitolerans]